MLFRSMRSLVDSVHGHVEFPTAQRQLAAPSWPSSDSEVVALDGLREPPGRRWEVPNGKLCQAMGFHHGFN